MTVNNIGVLQSISRVYENQVVQRFAEFLDARDIGRCECVCKLWKESCKSPEIWNGLTKREGLFFVEGKDRNRRTDFHVLYPMTNSGKRIGRYLGEVDGEIPIISEKIFNLLYTPDPFIKSSLNTNISCLLKDIPHISELFPFLLNCHRHFEKGKLIKDTFEFVVDFPWIKRTAGKETPLGLDEQGNLKELPADQVKEGEELVIPFSSRNLKVLCSYPLKGKENVPIFARYSDDKIFNQCGASSNNVRVYLMRKYIADESWYKTCIDQENFVNEKGFDITPFRIRILYDAVKILESGTCPDSESLWYTYARCSDILHYNDEVYLAAGIGGYAPCSGTIDVYGVDDESSHGVVPCVSAEALRPLAL